MFTEGRKLHDFGTRVGSHAEWVAMTTVKMADGKPTVVSYSARPSLSKLTAGKLHTVC